MNCILESFTCKFVGANLRGLWVLCITVGMLILGSVGFSFSKKNLFIENVNLWKRSTNEYHKSHHKF